MMNRFNNILIGVLWLLASTLGVTFWFNTMFGFNIFQGAHWQHLAYMQATGQSVKTSFYISMVVAVLIVTFGLYKLLQPRFRQITMPVLDRSNEPPVQTQPTNTKTVDVKPVVETPTNDEPAQTTPPAQPVIAEPAIARPPRLNIPNVSRSAPVPHVPLSGTARPKINPETDYADIHNIFESAGYVVKGAPKIKNVQTAVIAIGTDEVLWIGAVDAKIDDMKRAVQTLSDVFSDTLEDIEIHINAFIIGSPENADDTSIMQFATIDDLREYISHIPNTPPDADATEDFDAYSAYIGTVVDYIGKI